MVKNIRKGELSDALGLGYSETSPPPPPSPTLQKIRWIQPRGKAGLLGMEISVNNSSVSFGADLVEAIGGVGTQVKFGTAQRNGRMMILLVPGSGYRISQSKRGALRAGSPKLVSILREQGLPYGRYKVIKAQGGFIARPMI